MWRKLLNWLKRAKHDPNPTPEEWQEIHDRDWGLTVAMMSSRQREKFIRAMRERKAKVQL